MITFNEILAEGLSDVKAVAVAGIKAGKYKYENTDESRYQFVRDMKAEGFSGSAVTNAWKSAMVTGEFFGNASKTPKLTIKDKVLGTISSKGGYSAETRGERSRFMKDMAAHGSDMSLGKVWDELKKSGMLAGKGAKATAPAPVAKPVEAKKETGADKSTIKSILSKYEQIQKLLNEIGSEGRKLESAFQSANRGVRIHNLDTPDLYKQSVAISNSHYTKDISQIVSDRVQWIKSIK